MKLKLFLEMTYKGNIGFQEMMEFYQVASPQDIEEMERVAKKGDWTAFKKLIQKVTGRTLK